MTFQPLTANEIVEQIQEAFKEARIQGEDCLTNAEIADLMGLGLAATRQRVKQMISEGKVEPARKSVVNMAGQIQHVPAYRFIGSDS